MPHFFRTTRPPVLQCLSGPLETRWRAFLYHAPHRLFISMYNQFRPLMCKNACRFRQSMRLRNGTGATALATRASRARLRWPVVLLRHGPITATHAGLWCDFEKNGTGPAHVGQQWRALGARCNGWIERGVSGLRSGKPLVSNSCSSAVADKPARRAASRLSAKF